MTRNLVPWLRGSWRKDLADVISDEAELLAEVGLTGADVGSGSLAGSAARTFALRVPRAYVGRMRRGDPFDPLLRQVLVSPEEACEAPGFAADPLGETAAISRGMLRRFHGRALVVVTGACAVHCRYCFRRHFDYGAVAARDAAAALESVREDPAITEVILSGGDPWCLPDPVLQEWVREIEEIPHVRRIRMHTRMPVVLPPRVDEGLLEVLCSVRLPLIVVVHANHARELDDDVRTACGALRSAGATLLNQAVLLAGVNDTVEAQVDLAQELIRAGILPYYLHLLDRVAGAGHFEVAADRARLLMSEVGVRLPGYLVPRLVRDEEGAASKAVVSV